MIQGTDSKLASIPSPEDWLPTHVESKLDGIIKACEQRGMDYIAGDLRGVITLVRQMNQHRLEAERRASRA